MFRRALFFSFILPAFLSGQTLIYSTYLSGSNSDTPSAVATDAAGNTYVTGSTNSPNALVTNTIAPPCTTPTSCSSYVYVVKLNPAGALVYWTLIGGTGQQLANAIAVDAAGNAYIAGRTNSADFPVVNPLQATLKSGTSAFGGT